MNLEQSEKNMKKKGKVFQVILLTKSNENKSYVFATEKDALNFIEQQDFVAMHHLVPIDVHSFRK
ncbi:hypothetical protein [Staphylococcus phage VB-SauS-SA2]|nr:hypothetical protein [Staphylococcus phage VB-SauS-SA2]